MEPIRVLVAEDDKGFRDGLRDLLLSASDLEVVGEAGNGAEAISLAAEQQPDVILMDLNMPAVGGIEATRRIKRTSPHINILVISMFDNDDSIFAAMQAGARGYLLKGALKAEILRSIRAVSRGEAHFGSEIAKRMETFFSDPKPNRPQSIPELSNPERKILDLMDQGHTLSDIAEQGFFGSPQAVSDSATNIVDKLQSTDIGISAGVRQRLQQRKSERSKRFDRLSEIIFELQQRRDYEDDPMRQMKLNKEIEEKQEERDKVEKEINAIEKRLEG